MRGLGRAGLALSTLLSAAGLLADEQDAAAATPPGGVLQLATCPRQAGEYAAEIEDEIVLDRLFLDEKADLDAQLREAVGQQIKYLWGQYRNVPALHARAQLVLSAEPPAIEILARTDGRYDRDLDLAWSETGEHLRIEQPYQARAVARGRARADDPAVRVRYRARFQVALCGAPRPPVSELPTMLPRDPWLMHWTVPRVAHRKLCYFDECATTSPCNDNDYADLPHPFYHWYDWYPDRHGPDADGQPFDCRALLKPGRDYFARTVTLRRLPGAGAGNDNKIVNVAEPVGDSGFERLRRALSDAPEVRATVLIGVLDHDRRAADLGFAALAARFAPGAAADAALARAGSLSAAAEPRERGTRKWLDFLGALPGVMHPGKVTVEVVNTGAGEYLLATVEGTLARSRRPIRLRAYAGLTDVFGPTPPGHWPLLGRALAEDHLIVYGGHSGIGENFRLARIAAGAGVSAGALADAIARAPYQLIAFLSCYSYMYFGRDLVAAAGQTAGREFVYTGTDFTRGDVGALAVLDLVDQVLARVSAPSLGLVEPEDFLLIKRVDGRP